MLDTCPVSVPSLFRELLDDLALVAGAATVGDVVERASRDPLVGALAVPAQDLEQLTVRTRSLPPGRLSIVLSATPTGLRDAVAAAEAIPAVRIDRIQVGHARHLSVATLLDCIEDALDGRRVPAYVELPVRPSAQLLEQLLPSRFGAVLRTGGPWSDEGRELPIAETLTLLANACVPFVVEMTDAVDVFSTSRRGVRSIGFLNLLLATDAAVDGADREELVQILRAGGSELVEAVEELDPRVRRRLGSIGVTDVDRAVRGLVEVGLLSSKALVRTA